MERDPIQAYMRAPPMKRMAAVPKFSERSFWHGREQQYLISLITTQSTQEDAEMNLEELKSMSTADLLKLYNSMADRQVKRFASRADAERRTAELLRDKAEGESKPAAKVTGKKASKQASKPAQKAEGKKAGSKHIGAPRKEHSYEPISEGSKNYNPNKLTLHEKSARSIVFAKIASKPGITRRELEDKCDPEINVLASLSYLTKNGFITSKQA